MKINVTIEKGADVPEIMTGVERIAGISARNVETGDDVDLKGVEFLILEKEYLNGKELENDVRKIIEQNNPNLEINDINFSDDEVNF